MSAPMDQQITAASIDEVIFGEDPYALLGPAELGKLAETFFAHHYAGCPGFATAADRQAAIDPSRPETYPLMPTSVFKHAEWISVEPAAIEKWCLSSGTRGIESRIGRDQLTLDRLLGSVRAALSLIGDWFEDDLDVVHLGPPHEAAGDVWFPYVMSLTELIFPTTPCFVDGRLDHGLARETVEHSLAQGRHVGLIGPPFAMLDFCEGLDRPLPPGDGITVVSAGGWKRLDGQRLVQAEFDRKVCTALGLVDSERIRDAFNQVELNTVIAECPRRRKHIPPWVRASTRDPGDLSALPPGEPGLLSFVDLSATSYPAIFVGDDLGIVLSDPCGCGKSGDTLQILGRIQRPGERGCALELERRSQAS